MWVIYSRVKVCIRAVTPPLLSMCACVCLAFTCLNKLMCTYTYHFIWTIISANVPLAHHHHHLPTVILVIYFLYFPSCPPVIGQISVQARLYSAHGRKLWTSMTPGCLVRSLTQTHLAASSLSLGHRLVHRCVHSGTHAHTHTLTRLGTQALTRTGSLVACSANTHAF